MRPPRFLGPEFCSDFAIRKAFPGEDGHCPALLSCVPTDENSVDCLGICSEILDVCVAWDGAAHGLPVGDDHGGGFDDRARPTELLCSADLNAAGVEGDSAGLNLFDGHAAVFRFLSEFVRELDEVDEVCVEECDSGAARVDDLTTAKIEAVPVEEFEQGGDGENGRCAFGPFGRGWRLG